jgi:hypothetical protein
LSQMRWSACLRDQTARATSESRNYFQITITLSVAAPSTAGVSRPPMLCLPLLPSSGRGTSPGPASTRKRTIHNEGAETDAELAPPSGPSPWERSMPCATIRALCIDDRKVDVAIQGTSLAIMRPDELDVLGSGPGPDVLTPQSRGHQLRELMRRASEHRAAE